MVELEARPKFRRGEAPGRPIGGNIADTPFAHALRSVMIEAGFNSQISLSRALKERNNRNVSNWVTGKKFPSPEEVGEMLIVFDSKNIKTQNEKLNTFLDEYGNALRKRESLGIDTSGIIKAARKIRKSFDTPVSDWIETFCDLNRITLSGFFRQINCTDVSPTDRGGLSLPTLVVIEGGIRSKYGKKTGNSFKRAVNREIREKKKAGKKIRTYTIKGMKRIQRESKEVLYNGQETANILKTTRETIRNHRGKHGWGKLLTKGQVEILRNEIHKEAFPSEGQIYPLAN